MLSLSLLLPIWFKWVDGCASAQLTTFDMAHDNRQIACFSPLPHKEE
jgi:hypothetical protein